MGLLSIEQCPGTTGSIDADFIRHSTRKYLALYATTDDEMAVIADCGFGINQVHPSDGQQRVLSIQAVLVVPQTTNGADNTSASIWEITLDYGPWNPLEHSSDGNPTNLPKRFRLDFTLAPVAAFEDVDGNPIVNSAGDPYDPPLEREVTRSTLTVRWNRAPSDVDLPTLTALSNTLNVAEWNGFPEKTVRLAPVKLPEVEYSQVSNSFYYPMEYVFDINFDTWVKQVINAGFRQLDADGNLIPILINGVPATVPVPLDEDGHAILAPEFKDSGGDVPPDSDSGGESGEVDGGGEPPSGGDGVSSGSNLVVDAYDLIRTSDFSALGLDSIFTLPTI